MLTVADILQELEQEAQATRRILERLPDGRLDWKPHEKSMSLGQLGMHVANLPGAIVEASTRTFDVNTEIPRPGAGNTEEILLTLEESVRRARALLETMDDASLGDPWIMMNGNQEVAAYPRRDFLRSILLNHWYHHRGQLTVYLRLLDVPVPALYGDSADEKVLVV